MRKEKTKKQITGLDDERRNTANLKKKLNIEKHETIGGLDLPEGRELKEKSSKIPKHNYAATMVSAARRQIIGGGAPIKKSRRRRPQIVGGAARPAHGSNTNVIMRSRTSNAFLIGLTLLPIGKEALGTPTCFHTWAEPWRRVWGEGENFADESF